VVPEGKRDVLTFDTEVSGFGIRRYADGSAAYFIKYAINGRQKRLTLGAVRKGNLAKMRGLAEEVKARAKLGQDVLGDQRAAAAEQAAAETAEANAAPWSTLNPPGPRDPTYSGCLQPRNTHFPCRALTVLYAATPWQNLRASRICRRYIGHHRCGRMLFRQLSLLGSST
jgi:hypothetical protein